jgi:transposase
MNFSTKLSRQRISFANKVLGTNVTQRILSYSLYLQGASKTSISESLNIPQDTIKSLIKRIHSDGITAFSDRRNKVKPFTTKRTDQKNRNSISVEDDFIKINFGSPEKPIIMPAKNTLQLKTVLITLAGAGIVSNQEISNILGYSPNHIQYLVKKIQEEDVHALLDKRQGQKQHYRFTQDIKSELILQFILDVSNEKKVSGVSLSNSLKERVKLDLSPRSIRNHIEKLGLSKIKKQISDCMSDVKKTLQCLKKTSLSNRFGARKQHYDSGFSTKGFSENSNLDTPRSLLFCPFCSNHTEVPSANCY